MEVKKVACIGCGIIGSGWIANFAAKGLEVAAFEVNTDQLALAKERVSTFLKYLVDNEVIDEVESAASYARICFTTDMEEAVRDAQFIQESGPEKTDLKKSIYANIEKYAPVDAIIASSTSSLHITDISSEAEHPERFVGGHPYNPVHLMPLVEMTLGEKTDPESLARAKAFYKEVGKEPVVLLKESKGFICNRIQQAVSREATDLVCRGVCTVEDVDKAITFGPGLRWGIMGPMLISHLAGGKLGIDGVSRMMEPEIEALRADIARWVQTPYPNKGEILRGGVDAEMAARPAEIGNDEASLAQYRDKMLISLLKLHNKL